MMLSLRDSLDYTPVELDFGTSGLRGLVTDMTDLECYINVRGFLEYSLKEGLKEGNRVVVGGDLRDSTPRIVRAALKAIQDLSLVPVYAGFIPTPAVAFYALKIKAPGIMVTGSHIPSDRNGIKFYKTTGEVLKEDEAPIQAFVLKVRDKLYISRFTGSGFDKNGMLIDQHPLPSANRRAEELFVRRFKWKDEPLAGKQVVVYQHSAVGRDMLCAVLKNLGANVIPTGRSKSFIPIDTENVTSENHRYFRALAEKFPENFAIVSTDGDSDRPFVIDEEGVFHRGDVVGCVVADDLKSDFAVVPISANDAVSAHCANIGIELVHTKIGSPYVIGAMMVGAKTHKRVVGWEVNGGFMTTTDMIYHRELLEALPTRDAFLPIVITLIRAAKEQKQVSEIFQALPKRYTSSGLIDDIVPQKITLFKELISDQKKAERLINKLFKETELNSIQDINVQDGLKVLFAHGEIVHLRPSGNAPQFRVYTNADTQGQADLLVTRAIENGGYIEQLMDEL